MEREVAELAAELQEEDGDVARFERGLWSFLYGLFADREARLDKERREAAEAAVRHQEAVGARDRVAAELAAIEARLPALIGAEERVDELLGAGGARRGRAGDRRGDRRGARRRRGAGPADRDARVGVDVGAGRHADGLVSGQPRQARQAGRRAPARCRG